MAIPHGDEALDFTARDPQVISACGRWTRLTRCQREDKTRSIGK